MIISIHNIHVFFATVFPIEPICVVLESVESMRTKRFSLTLSSLSLFSLSLSSSFFTTCKQQQQQQQQQPISTRRRERQIGRRCGDRKMGRKRSRNPIVRRTGESIIILASFFSVSRKEHTSSLLLPSFVRFYTRWWSKVSLVALDVNSPLSSSVVSLFIPKRRTGAGDIFSRQYRVRSRAARDEENARRGEGFSSRVWTRLRSGNVGLDV